MRSLGLTLELRYKDPGGTESKLVQAQNVLEPTRNDDFSFASAVAAFALKLRNSEELHDFSFEQIISLAEESQENPSESRIEFVGLVRKAEDLVVQKQAIEPLDEMQ